jgi:membrane associated rhomboid family serine protease
MNKTSAVNNIKAIELARLLIKNYSYQEIMIKHISGIFLENKSAKYPLIRISTAIYKDTNEFDIEVNKLNYLLSEYKMLTQHEDASCLCLYFDGVVESKVNDINSIVLKTNDDLLGSEILNKEFSLLVSKFNLNKYDDTNVFMTNQQQNAETKTFMSGFDASLLVKKNRFTNIFILLFLVANLYINFQIPNPNFYYFDLSFYSVFIDQLQQFYRIITGLFINQGIIVVLIIAYYLYFFGKFIELKMGMKKTIIFYILGIISIIASMMFVEKGNLFLGSFPLVALVTGGYLGVIFLPSQRPFLKAMLSSSTMIFLMIILIFLSTDTTFITSLIALLMGVLLAFALNISDIKVNKTMLVSSIILIMVMISSGYLPYQDVARDVPFEQQYIKYQESINADQAKLEQTKIDNYYKNIGAVDFNE